MSAGPHFNPGGQKHGGRIRRWRHAGDFGNIASDANGNVNTEIPYEGSRLDTGPNGRDRPQRDPLTPRRMI